MIKIIKTFFFFHLTLTQLGHTAEILDEILVDDFNRGKTTGSFRERKTSLGINTGNINRFHGTWTHRPALALMTKDSQVKLGNQGYGLKLESAAPSGSAGYYSLLAGLDISKYNALSFYVKGQKGGEFFLIGLNDQYRYKNEMEPLDLGSVSLYIESGITTEWQEVIVPLCALNIHDPDKLDLTEMGSIIFDLDSKERQIIYLENLKFVKISPEPSHTYCL